MFEMKGHIARSYNTGHCMHYPKLDETYDGTFSDCAGVQQRLVENATLGLTLLGMHDSG